MNARRFVTSALLALGLAGSFVHASDKPNPASIPGPGEPTLAEVRRLTERFRDVNVALAGGYIRDPFDMCETAEMMRRPAALGAMGIHFFWPDRSRLQVLRRRDGRVVDGPRLEIGSLRTQNNPRTQRNVLKGRVQRSPQPRAWSRAEVESIRNVLPAQSQATGRTAAQGRRQTGSRCRVPSGPTTARNVSAWRPDRT